MSTIIKDITAEEILDSRGNPTLNVTVRTESAEGSFAVPSGASVGAYEALELRDGDEDYFEGKGVKKAIQKIEEKIKPALLGMEVTRQEAIDKKILELDGTENKSKLGGNATIGVSIAVAKAAARVEGKEVFEYLRDLADIKPSRSVPYLFMNLINGGKHAKSRLAFQEYHVIIGDEDVEQALNTGVMIQHQLGKLLINRLGPASANTGDEEGFVPDVGFVEQPLEFITQAVKDAAGGENVKLGLDVAASSFYKGNHYHVDGRKLSTKELEEFYWKLISKFHLFSIEDPFQEEDFKSFNRLRVNNPDLLIIGDDLTVTNKKRLEEAISRKSINAIIIKPNQVGTLTETLETMELARDNDIECIVSHRSGETKDDFIADLAYAFGCYGLKTGAPRGGERVAKYNRLLHISRLKPNKFDPIRRSFDTSKAQIVATIGPATKDKEVIKQMIKCQMDAVRLNFAWGTYEEHEHYIKTVREAAEELRKKIPIIQDLPGPRIQKGSGHGFNNLADSLITEKDLQHLKFGIEQKVDYVSMSYVGSAKDIIRLRGKIDELGADIPVIAKIERKEAVENIDEIIREADAIIIGRGDLANEVSIGEIPFIQKEIIEKAKRAGKPVITATQMLFSMVENPEPTRAEITDVSQAIVEGSDAVMLSEETAIGKYPVEVIKVMEGIVLEAEKHEDVSRINPL